MRGFSEDFSAGDGVAWGRGRQTRFPLFVGRVADVVIQGDESDFLDGVPALALALTSYLDVHAPFDGLFYFLEGIHTDAVSPAGNSDKNAALFHDDDRLEADATDEGVRLGDGWGEERENIKTLGVTQKQVVWGEKGAAGGRGAKVGRGEVGGENGERKAELGEGWRGQARRGRDRADEARGRGAGRNWCLGSERRLRRALFAYGAPLCSIWGAVDEVCEEAGEPV